MTMTITQTPEEEAWIAEAVMHGEFASKEEAVRAILAHGIAGLEAQSIEDDPEQVEILKEMLAEAQAEVERGNFVTLQEHNARMDALFKRRRS